MDKAEAARIFTPAAAEAVTAFPISPGEVSLVAVGENITFRVTDTTDGAAYVLRLHRPGYNSLEELNSERKWIAALIATGLAAPVGLAARDGRWFVPVEVSASGETRQAGMTHWTDGQVLAETLGETADPLQVDDAFRQLGRIAATIHNQSSGWTAPPGFVRHALDADGLMGEAPFWGRFWEHPALSKAERAILEGGRTRLHAALVRLGQDRRTYGLIHADLHPGNVLMRGEILTVIDFDDAAFGWHGYEIAVALLNYRTDPRFPAIKAALLAGYRQIRPLSPHTESLIPLFLLIRQMAVIGWLYQRPEIDPGSRLDAFISEACAGCVEFEPPR